MATQGQDVPEAALPAYGALKKLHCLDASTHPAVLPLLRSRERRLNVGYDGPSFQDIR